MWARLQYIEQVEQGGASVVNYLSSTELEWAHEGVTKHYTFNTVLRPNDAQAEVSHSASSRV
jgi:hypothetical protein